MKKKFIPFLALGVVVLALVFKLGFKSETKEWMEDQVHEDLSIYAKEDLNPQRIETSFNTLPNTEKLVHFQIKDNQIYWKINWEGEGEDRVRKICRMLNYTSRQKKLPDVDFLLTVHDGILFNAEKGNQKSYLPIFCFAKRKDVHAILFPDPLSESFARKGRKQLSYSKLRPKFSWKNKKEIAFWRGGTTGGDYLMNTWHLMPRTKLSLLSQYYPDQIDAGFSVYNPMPEEVKEEMLKSLPILNWVNHKGHLRYKYLVIADGNTCTYPRFYLSLCSGCVTFKDLTEDYQWFYRALEPYKHYVPVAKDFSDLPEKVEWAKEHDEEVKKIAKNSQKFINNNLLPKHIYQYVGELLEKYSKLQDAEFSVLEDMNKFDSKVKK